MEREQRIKALEWFAIFANADLDSIAGEDRRSLCEHAKLYLWPQEARSLVGDVVSEARNRKLAAIMSWATRKLPRVDSAEFWEIITALQPLVREELTRFIASITTTRTGRPASGYPFSLRAKETVIFELRWGGRQLFALSQLVVTPDQGDYLRVHLWQLLEGFPGYSIRLCRHCKKFFFNPTQRNKVFCSNACGKRSSAARYRRENPDKVRDYQRLLMSDRYWEKKGEPRVITKARKR
jgi:hypothetical protein